MYIQRSLTLQQFNIKKKRNHQRSFVIKGLCPVLNKNWFCCRRMHHTRVAECAWNGRGNPEDDASQLSLRRQPNLPLFHNPPPPDMRILSFCASLIIYTLCVAIFFLSFFFLCMLIICLSVWQNCMSSCAKKTPYKQK